MTTRVPRMPTSSAGIAIISKPSVSVIDESKVPEVFFKSVLDLKAIEAALLRGDSVPGVLLTTDKSVRVTPSKAV